MHSKGVRYSAGLHIVLLLLMTFGLPSFFHKEPDPEPMAISVDILPIAPKSNVKPQEKPPEKIEEKKPVAETKTEKKQVTAAKPDEPNAEPEPKPLPTPAKEIIKKEEKKPEKKPKPKKDDDLSKILKSVQDQAKAEQSNKPTEQAVKPNQHEAKSDHYDSSIPLSMSEMDVIRQQVSEKWHPPAGAKEAYNLKVTLHLTVSQDGTVTGVELATDQSRYNSDTFFRAAADSAMRAVKMASPLKNLPPDKYSTWQDFTISFDPKDLL